MPPVDLDAFAQTIWPRRNDTPFLRNMTLIYAGDLTDHPIDAPLPLSKAADRAAENNASFAAIRFHPGGDRELMRAYAWVGDGPDSATYELKGEGHAVRTAETPPPLPDVEAPKHQDLTLEEFVAETLTGRPDVLEMSLPNVCYVIGNRRALMYGAKIDFSKGEPPFVSRISLEKEGGRRVAVCHAEDTQSGRAFRYTRPVKKPLFGSPVPTGPWSQPAEVPSILEKLRATLSR